MAMYYGVLFGSSVIDDVRCVTVKAGGFRLCVVVDMLVRSRWILRCPTVPFPCKRTQTCYGPRSADAHRWRVQPSMWIN
jgi:hypothetical protein